MRLPICLAILLSTAVLSINTPAVAAAEAKSRVWTSASGGFSIKGTYVELKTKPNGSLVVVIKKENGKTISVPLNKLSKADQAYVKKQRGFPLGDGDADGGKAGGKADGKADKDDGGSKVKVPPAKPPAPSLSKADAEELLSERNLLRKGDAWILDEEELLDSQLLHALGELDKLEELQAVVSERQQRAAGKLKKELAHRTKANEDYIAVNRVLRSTYTDVAERNHEFATYARAARAKLKGIKLAMDAIEQARLSLFGTLQQMDLQVANVVNRYQALTQESEVFAAIKVLGGTLGSGETLVATIIEFDKMADQYLPPAELLSRDANTMVCGRACRRGRVTRLDQCGRRLHDRRIVRRTQGQAQRQFCRRYR